MPAHRHAMNSQPRRSHSTAATTRFTVRRPTHPIGRPGQVEATRTVLVADDDQAFLCLLTRAFRGLPGFKVVTVPNGRLALRYLERNQVDVLVTDLQMPVLDGYSLIGEVAARFPHIPVFVITGASPEMHQYRPIHLGALLVFPKPPHLSSLLEEVQSAVERPLDGDIRGLSLQSLLQVLEWERKDCTMIVHGEEATGLLYIKDGQLIHGAVRDRQGLLAVLEILGWHLIRVEFVNTCKVESSISASLPNILMEAALAKDHAVAKVG